MQFIAWKHAKEILGHIDEGNGEYSQIGGAHTVCFSENQAFISLRNSDDSLTHIETLSCENSDQFFKALERRSDMDKSLKGLTAAIGGKSYSLEALEK